MDSTTVNAAQTAPTDVAQNAAQPVTQSKLTAKVTSVYFNKYEENSYYTISLRLNKSLKLMVQNESGLYEDGTSQFLNKPAGAMLEKVTDDVANYYLATQGISATTLSTALSSAELTIRQKLFAAGETDGEITNESDHDQWFTFIDKLSISKMAKLVMSKQLGLSIDELKLLLEE